MHGRGEQEDSAPVEGKAWQNQTPGPYPDAGEGEMGPAGAWSHELGPGSNGYPAEGPLARPRRGYRGVSGYQQHPNEGERLEAAPMGGTMEGLPGSYPGGKPGAGGQGPPPRRPYRPPSGPKEGGELAGDPTPQREKRLQGVSAQG